jgi:hypothetical protein
MQSQSRVCDRNDRSTSFVVTDHDYNDRLHSLIDFVMTSCAELITVEEKVTRYIGSCLHILKVLGIGFLCLSGIGYCFSQPLQVLGIGFSGLLKYWVLPI